MAEEPLREKSSLIAGSQGKGGGGGGAGGGEGGEDAATCR
jgi:hypothetical protein